MFLSHLLYCFWAVVIALIPCLTTLLLNIPLKFDRVTPGKPSTLHLSRWGQHSGVLFGESVKRGP